MTRKSEENVRRIVLERVRVQVRTVPKKEVDNVSSLIQSRRGDKPGGE